MRRTRMSHHCLARAGSLVRGPGHWGGCPYKWHDQGSRLVTGRAGTDHERGAPAGHAKHQRPSTKVALFDPEVVLTD